MTPFNVLGAIGGAVKGFITGGSVGALAGGIGGAIGGAGNGGLNTGANTGADAEARLGQAQREANDQTARIQEMTIRFQSQQEALKAVSESMNTAHKSKMDALGKVGQAAG